MKSVVIVLSLVTLFALTACNNADMNPSAVDPSASVSKSQPNATGTDNNGVDKSPLKGNRVEGTITALNLVARSVTISAASGTSVTVFATASTKIERNAMRVSLSSFKVGDRGQAIVDPTSMLASKIEAIGV